jgi:hypothetical protein
MGKKKANPPKASPESTLNPVGLTNELRPRRDPDTGKDYLRKKVKDETGKVVKEELVSLISAEGQELVKQIVREQLRDTPTGNEMKFANEVLHKEAQNHPPEKPSSPITGTAPVEQQPKSEQPQKKTRPEFHEFITVVADTDVVPFLDSQNKARIEITTEIQNGIRPAKIETNSYEIGDQQVWAWLFRIYFNHYGIPPEDKELRKVVQWLKSEAYGAGLGKPGADDDAADAVLEDDAVFIGVRKYCCNLSKPGDQTLAAPGNEVNRDLKYRAESEGANIRIWPERPSDVSAKLKRSSHLLKRFNVKFVTEHRRNGSYWYFEFSEEPPKASPPADKNPDPIPPGGDLFALTNNP